MNVQVAEEYNYWQDNYFTKYSYSDIYLLHKAAERAFSVCDHILEQRHINLKPSLVNDK